VKLDRGGVRLDIASFPHKETLNKFKKISVDCLFNILFIHIEIFAIEMKNRELCHFYEIGG
jgi:hypothetical protein